MLMAVASLSIMDATGKWLVVGDIPVNQLIAVRGWIISAILVLMLPKFGGVSALRSQMIKMHLLRVIAALLAPLCFFQALKSAPLADATVIMFSSTFMMTALSGILLNDRVDFKRWLVVIVGFIGVLVALRPSGQIDLYSGLLLLVASFCYAVMMLSVRWLGRTEPTFRLLFFANIGVALSASLTLPWAWAALNGADVAGIAFMAVFALCGHFFITRAFSISPVPVIAPLEYTAILWAGLLGYLIWQELPDRYLIIGATIIAGAGIGSIFIETRRQLKL